MQQFYEPGDAAHAKDRLDGYNLDGRNISVLYAQVCVGFCCCRCYAPFIICSRLLSFYPNSAGLGRSALARGKDGGGNQCRLFCAFLAGGGGDEVSAWSVGYILESRLWDISSMMSVLMSVLSTACVRTCVVCAPGMLLYQAVVGGVSRCMSRRVAVRCGVSLYGGARRLSALPSLCHLSSFILVNDRSDLSSNDRRSASGPRTWSTRSAWKGAVAGAPARALVGTAVTRLGGRAPPRAAAPGLTPGARAYILVLLFLRLV